MLLIARLGALQRPNLLLEHRDGRIGAPAVVVARLLAARDLEPSSQVGIAERGALDQRHLRGVGPGETVELATADCEDGG